MNNATFEKFIGSLASLINDLKEKYGAELVYDETNDKEKNKYWNDVKCSIDAGEKWLLSRLDDNCENLDRHKYSALLLIVLIKKPLFKFDTKNKSVGYCLSGFNFAWKAALNILGSFIQKDKNIRYAEYIRKNGVIIPSEKYIPETFRSFYICFRPFKKEKKPDEQAIFPSMLADLKNCGKENWGFALLFANIFSLIEIYSMSRYECKILRRKAFKNTPSQATPPISSVP
jgi:hypothetical protein